MSTSREPSPIYALSEGDFAPLATAAESPSEVFTPRTSPSPLEAYWSNRKGDLQVATERSSNSSESSTPPWICESSSNETIGVHNLNVSGTQHGRLESDTCITSGMPFLKLGPPSETAAILDAREARYGGFKNNSKVAQIIKAAMKAGNGWDKLLPTQQEALDQIASKISRIVSGGDTSYADSWRDISGYAELVVKELRP